MHHPDILLQVNGVLLGFFFGQLIGARRGEETQLSKAEKALLEEKAAEFTNFWPLLAWFFVVFASMPFFVLLSQGEHSVVWELLVVPHLGLLGLFMDLSSRKRQRLVREILS